MGEFCWHDSEAIELQAGQTMMDTVWAMVAVYYNNYGISSKWAPGTGKARESEHQEREMEWSGEAR